MGTALDRFRAARIGLSRVAGQALLLRSPPHLFEPWRVHSGDAFLLVHALIVADLAE
jgi:hypothetical protein